MNISLLDGSHYSLLLKPRENAIEIPQAETGLQLVFSYTRLGIEHILEGWDHLAFVAALMLIVSGWPMLFKTITAFTLAHSITLGLATLDYVSLPPPPVEAMIALSIVLIAAEAIQQLHRGRQTLASRWPWTLAFTFGLLHGFGFAGALKEIGLPQVDVPVALLFLNVGELGQLLFIATSLALTGLYRKLATLPKSAPVYSAYVIGTLATFWLIERLDSMRNFPSLSFLFQLQ